MRRSGIIAILLAAALALPAAGKAAVLVRIEQDNVRSEVHVTARGSLDLSGLGAPQIGSFQADDMLVIPNQAYVPSGITGASIDVYQNVFSNRFSSIGSGARPSHWSQTTGGFFAINGGGDALLLPRGYASGEEIFAYTGYLGEPGWSLESMGITPGRYRFDMANGDHVTVVATVAPVPLPAALPLTLAGFAFLAASARMRRRYPRG